MRALLVANSDDADPGFVGQRLRHHGYAFTECIRERPHDWPDPTGYDLVLLLGSDWSVYWDRVASEVRAEAALVRAVHDAGRPLFGICFGSQMIAHALGGRVERAARPEVGWHRIDSDRPEAIADGPWMQWHFDAFATPPGFAELARSESGPQVIRGGRTVATQFHPEATESIVARWSAGLPDDLTRLGLTGDGLVDETRRQVGSSRPRAEAIVDWFLTEVVGS